MSGIYEVIAEFMSEAIVIACFIGIVTRCGNILVRAFTGKEDIL